MAFDDPRLTPLSGRSAASRAPVRPGQRFAVIGAGVSGLSAAWLLSKDHDVVVYEAARRLGGHSNTVDVPVSPGRGPQGRGGGGRGEGGTVGVDAGFIVFNRPAYPNLTAWLDHLGVGIEDTCMSFGCSMRGGAVEYSGRSLRGVFARPLSVFSSSHWAMLADIPRFHRDARGALDRELPATTTLRTFFSDRGYSAAFMRDFMEPIAAAIWSTPSIDVLNYPAASFFRFFANHGLLQVLNLPSWNTVTGGSRAYVEKVAEALGRAARTGTPVAAVRRLAEGGVEVVDHAGHADRFDGVLVATHADAALRLIAEPTRDEAALLSAFRYQPNRAVVHFDTSLMPKRRSVWSSWNYLGGDGAPAVTYWMNKLQNLDCGRDVFVTLNPARRIADDDVVAAFDYTHPMFDVAAGKAQKQLWRLQGVGGVWYAGAHFGQGFHEDGLQAGLAAAEDMGGVRRPWRVENESGRIWLAPDAGEARALEAA